MGPIMEGLLRLQHVEVQLHQIELQRAARRRAVRTCQKKIEDFQNQIDAVKQQTQQLQMEADRRQMDLQAAEASIEKLRAQLNMAKTNRSIRYEPSCAPP